MPRTLAVALALTLAGCATYLERSGAEPPVSAPRQFAQAFGGASTRPEGERDARGASAPEIPSSPSRWGTALGAPELDPLLARAIRANQDVRAALGRIGQANALARQARAARLPSIGAEGTGGFTSTVRPPFGRSEASELTFSLPVSYEVDLYGRYALDHRASRLEEDAAEGDASTIAISIAAEAAESWLDVVESHARRALLEAQLESNRSYLELVTLRFRGGLTSNLDVHQQQQLVARSEALVALVRSEEIVASNELAVLLGEAPGRRFAAGVDRLPTLPPAPDAGIPATLLERRPDLAAAALRLRAADARVASAIRSQLPAIRLEAVPGHTTVRQSFSGAVGSIGGIPTQQTVRGFVFAGSVNASVPVFDGLRGPALSDQRRAEVAERLAEYRQAYLTALAEVETAIALERQERVNIGHLERLVEAAKATLETAKTRYSAGLSDYLQVLTALRSQQDAELVLLAARRRLLSHRLQLYRALGASLPVGDLE